MLISFTTQTSARNVHISAFCYHCPINPVLRTRSTPKSFKKNHSCPDNYQIRPIALERQNNRTHFASKNCDSALLEVCEEARPDSGLAMVGLAFPAGVLLASAWRRGIRSNCCLAESVRNLMHFTVTGCSNIMAQTTTHLKTST